MWIHRRMLRISYKQHTSNEDILVGLNVKPDLMKMIQKENEDILTTLLEARDITTNNYCWKAQLTAREDEENQGILGLVTSETEWKWITLVQLNRRVDHDQW